MRIRLLLCLQLLLLFSGLLPRSLLSFFLRRTHLGFEAESANGLFNLDFGPFGLLGPLRFIGFPLPPLLRLNLAFCHGKLANLARHLDHMLDAQRLIIRSELVIFGKILGARDLLRSFTNIST